MAKTKQTKEFKVAPEDAVIIEYTDKAAYYKAGERSTVHRYLAGKLEKKGVAKIIQDPAQPTEGK